MGRKMSGPCVYYDDNDPTQGCPHPAGYLAWDDDLQTEIDLCAHHYGEPHNPGECPHEHDFGPAPITDKATCTICDIPVMDGALLPIEWPEKGNQND